MNFNLNLSGTSKYLRPFLYLGVFYLTISFILRIVFFVHPITTSSFGILESIRILSVGMVKDFVMFFPICSVFTLYTLFLSEAKYKKPWGQAILILLILTILYLTLSNNIFKQYGGVVLEIVLTFIGIKTFLFAIMLVFPKKRRSIRNILYFFTILFYIVSIILNSISEYFFWNEFGVRYNFIAVDYLIYTNEVIGNIMESYPILPLFSAIFVVSTIISWIIYKKTKECLIKLPNLAQKTFLFTSYLVISIICLGVIPSIQNIKNQDSFADELQSNGVYKFYYAFTHSELDYFKFYPTIDDKIAENIYLSQFSEPSINRQILNKNLEEQRKNVVLISVESLSAEFMEHYGNTDKITPFLDSLADRSLLFTNLYATGNRTVRGLEALTLSIPPTAGESMVKRKDNKNKFTIGSIFKSKGYDIKYMYGGFCYFDNMQDFFEGNDYSIVDRSDFKPKDITFANIWGVSDEDMAKKIVEVISNNTKSGKNIFYHWMTVSNHRPFTYPDGRIDIPSSEKSRKGGVKYTDYSMKLFFELAEKQPWYNNTVFVIVSDHCASSAGSTELPLDRYRIPAMIFTPDGSIKPQKFTGLMSQIDLMPTLLGQLNFRYESKFLGQDVLSESYVPRAYIATYQDLGYLKDDHLTIISPNQKVKQYSLKLKDPKLPHGFNIYYDEVLVEKPSQNLVNEAIATYQSVSKWIKESKLDR